MRALVLKEFGNMIVESVPDPVAGPGEVVLDVVATGICGSDIHGYTGKTGRRKPGQIMGHESVGRIKSLGEGVDPASHEIGSAVTFNPVVVSAESRRVFHGREQHAPDALVIGVAVARNAAFAEQVVVPAGNLVVLPQEVPIVHGALVEPLAVALNASRRVGIRSGDVVLVLGGGPIGQCVALAVLHEAAARVYVSEPNAERRALCETLGAIVIDPNAGDVTQEIMRLEGRLVDVAIDAVGISASLDAALNSTTFGGRVCLVGMGAPSVDVDAYRVSTEERSIIGSFAYTFETFHDAATWVSSGDPVFGSLISFEVALADGPAAFRRLAELADVPGKVLVRLDK